MFEDAANRGFLKYLVACDQLRRKKGNLERFTLFNRAPSGKFNGVNVEPVNAYNKDLPYYIMSKYLIKKIGDIVTVKIFDRMVDRQTKALSQGLQQSILASGGKIRLFLIIETHIPSNSPEALFENLQFVKLHADFIDRIAIVGRKGWERTCVGLFGLFGGVEIEYFDRSETAQAFKWLQAKKPDKRKAADRSKKRNKLISYLKNWGRS